LNSFIDRGGGCAAYSSPRRRAELSVSVASPAPHSPLSSPGLPAERSEDGPLPYMSTRRKGSALPCEDVVRLGVSSSDGASSIEAAPRSCGCVAPSGASDCAAGASAYGGSKSSYCGKGKGWGFFFEEKHK
jgi:uncharacterized membrane protein